MMVVMRSSPEEIRRHEGHLADRERIGLFAHLHLQLRARLHVLLLHVPHGHGLLCRGPEHARGDLSDLGPSSEFMD